MDQGRGSPMGRVGDWRGARAVLRVLVLVIVLVWHPLPAGAVTESANIRVPVLVYHNVDYSGSAFSVTPEQLDAECRWLIDNGYTAITVWQFWDAAMGSGTSSSTSPRGFRNECTSRRLPSPILGMERLHLDLTPRQG